MFNEKGEMQRPQAQFRNFISSEPGSKFPPEKGRYHLYISYGCPWGKIVRGGMNFDLVHYANGKRSPVPQRIGLQLSSN